MVARAWVLIFFTAPFFETVEKVYNFRAAYWFSLPFAYKRKRECENRAFTTLRAGAQLNVSKALKGCGGKQEFSPAAFVKLFQKLY